MSVDNLKALNIDIKNSQYQAMIGVGGIGSGRFFQLNGNHTLGREESRSGQFLDTQDYCKLHIIAHYVQALLGRDFTVFPVGKIGNDDVGKTLLKEMTNVGMDVKYVVESPDHPTLFSFCFLYPDGSGGNMTTNDSACATVDPVFVDKSIPEFKKYASCGIVLAAPEVPMQARKRLLDLATEHNFYRFASFTSEEMIEAIDSRLLQKVDLLAINLDEAAAAAKLPVEGNDSKTILEAAIKNISSINNNIKLSVTDGKNGSWSWDGQALTQIASLTVNTQSTAGAGDAYLGGLIVGLVAGLTFEEMHQLAALVGSHSVLSPHTINFETGRDSLSELAEKSPNNINDTIMKLLKG